MKTLIPKTAHAVNELWLPEDRLDDNQSAVIYAANEARFTASNYSEPLTAYTSGWRDPENLDAVLDNIAPAVPVGRRFEFKKATNSEAFYSEGDDIRAIGSAFKRVEYRGETVNSKTLNKGLTLRLDKDDMLGDGDEELAVGRLMQRLTRNEIRRALSALNEASNDNPVTWDPAASTPANPDKDLRATLTTATGKSGVRPNRVVMAESAWNARLDVYEAIDTPAAGRKASYTPAELAAYLMVDLVEVVKARYQSTSSAKSLVQSTLTVLHYWAAPGMGKDDPSNIKRFITPVGARFRVFRQESDKWVDLSVEHYSNIVITSTLGIEKNTVDVTE